MTMSQDKRSSTVLLHGGGMDSSAVFLYLRQALVRGVIKDFDVLHIDFEHLASSAEKQAIHQQLRMWLSPSHRPYVRFRRFMGTVPEQAYKTQLFTGNHKDSAIIDGRNLNCVLQAANAGYQTIYMGLDKPATGHAWPDASQEFIDSINKVLGLSYLTSPCKVIAPFIQVPKLSVYREALKQQKDFFDLSMTCWTPAFRIKRSTYGFSACGKCKHCKLKKEYKEKLNVR